MLVDMSKTKLVENIVLAMMVYFSLQIIIFPGLASENFIINVLSLTSFFLLVVFVIFGQNWYDSEEE
jgi:hypothetical protein